MSKSCGGGDGLNLEYLKNVVLRYMLSSDAGDREHMLKASRFLVVPFLEPLSQFCMSDSRNLICRFTGY